MTIYLYVKTHLATGLKYLGKTTKNPYKYNGSGVYWTAYLKKHGYLHTTEILKECTSNDEIKEWGLYYSNLWNIVESDNWANLKPESGDGNTSNTAKEIANRPYVKEAIRASSIARWTDPEYRKRVINSLKITNSLQKTKEKRSSAAKEVNSRLDVQIKNKQHSTGSNSWRYDSTIYHFKHKDGREEYLTQNEMRKKYNLTQPNLTATIKGRQKSISGWLLV